VQTAARRAKDIGVAWTGVIGGVLGFSMLIALAVAVAAGAGDASRLYAIPLAALSTIFAVGVFVSVMPLETRETALRGVVIASLVMVVVGAVAFGPELPVVLTPAIGLLAQAAGFIFQGSSKKR
jgi:hypothetical protein